ncbi:MAG: steroid delta-isomerase, partial [Bacteroidota bacterium]
MKITLTLTLALLSNLIYAQQETEVYVFDLQKSGNSYSISNPWNATYKNPGYDNQPHFLADGKSMYYVSTNNGQTDVAEVEFRELSWAWLSATEGGEYSPTPIPDGSGFSAIRLDKDGTQLLYKYPNNLSKPSVLVPQLKIGYHCWFDQNTIVAFVLGDPSTLQICNLKENKNQVLDKNIGRSLHKIPNKNRISYISKETTPWQIK